MGRAEREQQVQELRAMFGEFQMAVLTDYRGLTVEEATEFRKRVRAAGGGFRVVKNTLAKRAAEGTSMELIKDSFTGPVGVLYSTDDPVPPAKALVDYIKVNQKLEAGVGILEGKVITYDDVKMLAELPDRDTLTATVLATMQAPTSSFVRLLSEVPASFVRVLDSIRAAKAA